MTKLNRITTGGLWLAYNCKTRLWFIRGKGFTGRHEDASALNAGELAAVRAIYDDVRQARAHAAKEVA